MNLVIQIGLVTEVRGFKPGDKVYWPDAADAQRLIDAGHAKLDDEAEAKAKTKTK